MFDKHGFNTENLNLKENLKEFKTYKLFFALSLLGPY